MYPSPRLAARGKNSECDKCRRRSDTWNSASQDFLSTSGLNLNDTLRLASIWHSLHAIAAQLAPAPGCSGIDALFADTFTLHCFQVSLPCVKSVIFKLFCQTAQQMPAAWFTSGPIGYHIQLK